jgi:hypothetical protein
LERERLEETCDDGYLMALSSDISWHYNVLRGTIMSFLSKHPSQKFRTASHFDKNIYECNATRNHQKFTTFYFLKVPVVT